MCRDTITADRERHLQRCRRRLRKVCNADACGAGRLLQAIQRVPEGLQLGACVTLSPIFQKMYSPARRHLPGRDRRLGQVRRPLRLRGESVRLHGPAGASGPVELPERGAVERPPGERGLLPDREPLRGVRDGRQGAAAHVGRRDQPGSRGQSWPPTCRRADMSAGVGRRADLPKQTSPGPGPEGPEGGRAGTRT